MRKLIIAILLLIPTLAWGEIVSVCNMDSSASVQVRIYDITDTTEDVAWTATGVTERAVGLSKSCYYYNMTKDSTHAYQIDWRDAASPTKVASETLYETDTRVDVAVSTRGTSTYAGGAVASVTGAVGSVTAGVTVTTNNDKTGYSLHADYDAAKTAAPASTALSNVTWTDTKAGYVDAAIGNRPTLAQIEASTKLLIKTSGSTTNEVGVSADNRVNANAVTQESDKTAIAQAVWDSTEVSTRKLTSAYTDETVPRDMAATGGTGTGGTHVNHDTGGTNNLTFQTSGGVGIWGATVKAYLKTDYDAGNTGDAYVKGQTTTKIDGTWSSDLMLDSGFTYTIEFYKAGSYGPNTKEVTI